MQTLGIRRFSSWTLISLAAGAGACNSVSGLSDFSVSSVKAECTLNSQCSEWSVTHSADGMAAPAVCVQPEGRCALILSDDCSMIAGELSDDSVVIGSLLSTVGAQEKTNLLRQQSIVLAVNQINAAGGIPPAGDSVAPRKLALAACNDSVDMVRAARHLVDELKVPAIVGPNNSENVMEVSNEVSIRGGTVVISPTAIASNITALIDDDLTWQMIPTDVQRAPLMISQINDLENQLKAERSREFVRLGIVYRNDALGTGTRTSLNGLVINGKPISDAVNVGNNVLISAYDFDKVDGQQAIVERYLDFAPDIVVVAGTAEAVVNIMQPLEARWTANPAERPYYVLIDPSKVPDLVNAVKDNPDFRHRVRGTGSTSGADTQPIFNAFKLDYQVAFPASNPTTSGLGPTFDATYAIAYALSATRGQPVSGRAVSEGLRLLAGGPTKIETGSARVLVAFQKLAAGERIDAMGTFGRLGWDTNGATIGGTLEMWCIGQAAGDLVYQSSGLTFNLETQQTEGEYVQCGP